jgi:hypothetical protein
MFYDEKDRHVRTKKEILDENGEIRKGCYIIPKGEIYEMSYFGPKDSRFRRRGYLDEVRQFYTRLMNQVLEMQGVPESKRMQVFDQNGPYLATKKIGKNNPKEAIIKSDNEVRKQWNSEVDAALVAGVPEEELVEFRKEEITDKIQNSIKMNGNKPELLSKILKDAMSLLRRLVTQIYMMSKSRKPSQDMYLSKRGTGENCSADVFAEYDRLKPMHKELWEFTRKKRWNESRRDTLKQRLEGLQDKAENLSEKVKLQTQIRYKERKIAEYDLKMKAAALNYGYSSIRDATNAYWRAKDAMEKIATSETRKASSQQSKTKQTMQKTNPKRPSILQQLKEKRQEIDRNQKQGNRSKRRSDPER